MTSKYLTSSSVTLLFGFLLLAAPCGANAQGVDSYAALRDSLEPGRTSTSITSVSDPSQSYAVHLPSPYRPDRKWPALLLMDPRGRALVPLERFREAAERRGYILVSSYNTASDTGKDLNSPAVKAMLTDAPHLFSAEENGFYLVGFSGTARTAWTFAKMYRDRVAGIIAFGGGLPLGHSAPWDATFAFYGAAGVFDFNFDEMVRLDHNLDLREMAHTFESFQGRHEWGPIEICARSVDWMDLMAMKAGRRTVDSGWIEETYLTRLATAETLATEQPYGALLQSGAILEAFQGLIDDGELAHVKETADSLESDRAVQRAVQAQDEAVVRYYRFKKRFAELLDAVDTDTSRPDAAAMIEALEIDLLQEQAAAATDDEAGGIHAQSARRLLEVVYVQCSFYLPRDYVRDGRPWAAVLALEVADAVRPLDLEAFLDQLGLGSLREEPALHEWIARRSPR